MARNGKKRADATLDAEQTGGLKRRVRRIERKLEQARELQAKRSRQLEEARDRAVALEARLIALQAPAPSAGVAPSAGAPAALEPAGPQAFCMREKRMVAMVEPEAIVMRNGRAALSGTCGSCGAHVVTTARAAAEALANGRILTVEA